MYDLGEISECTVVASVAEAAVFGFGKIGFNMFLQ